MVKAVMFAFRSQMVLSSSLKMYMLDFSLLRLVEFLSHKQGSVWISSYF